MSEAIGADIESICRKCGDVWHVVVSKKDDKIAKVQCKQCGGVHRLKRPGGAGASAAKAPRGGVTTRKSAAAKAPPVTADPGRPARGYHPKERFAPGDRVVHPSFGEGVVQSVQGTKMTVHFPQGERKLVHGR
ncbi:MAG: DUF3553 domain-containing protein [Deltaproteobacteria bacterium]|nr:DUF3553 domain-containing protein [Deltaproteobacteria bacterium]